MNRPVIDLREFADLTKIRCRETINVDGIRYLYIVFKSKDGTYGWYYHECEEPYAFHDFATGFSTEKEAKEDVVSTIKGK